MGWTAPRTWVATEVVTAALMNAQIRDNQTVLKVTRDAVGRVSDLSSTTLADLSAANLTNLVDPAGANSFTGGKHDFGGGAATRIVVPVGADKYGGSSGNKTSGSLWVEGTYLHHVDDAQDEWRYLGTFISSPAGAVLGSVWVQGSNARYIDASGDERRVDSSETRHNDAAAGPGSLWAETYIHSIRETGTYEQVGHNDIAHADHTDHGDHTDHNDNGPHTDHNDHNDGGSTHVDHTDHTDYTDHDDGTTPHDDHDDGGHDDEPYEHFDHDDHLDVGDLHNDHTDHTDYEDHGDSGGHADHDDHSDGTPHDDITADSRPVFVGPA